MEPSAYWNSGCRRQGCALSRSALLVAAPAVNFALTVLNGDPGNAASWRREVLPVYPRWHRALAEAVAEGRKVKANGEQ